MAPDLRPRAVLLLCLLLALPLAVAGRPTEAFDPAHDVAVHERAVLVPVDSIDLLHASVDDSDGALRGARLRVVDLERAGFEDFLFTRQHAHSLRTWGVVGLLDDGTPFTALALDYDPPVGEWDQAAIALRFHRDGTYDDLQATFTRSVEDDTLTWSLGAPVEGVRVGFFAAFAGLSGCDADGACDAGRGLVGSDAAPDDAGQHVASVVPSVWWEDVFPTQEEAGPLAAARDLLVQAWGAAP